jgi:Copper binding periplasmic protein CusF
MGFVLSCEKFRETAMKIAKLILAGAFALPLISSATFAQQALTGTVTQIDRINGTVGIRQAQDGTTGANSTGAAEEFKAPRGFSLDTLHAGDRVSFSVTEADGVKTLTKLEKQ